MVRLNGQAEPVERRDVVLSTNPALAKALLEALHKTGVPVPPGEQRRRASADGPEREARLAVRRSLIEAPESDPKGYERIIGESDLTSTNYLRRGSRAGEAVCRIRVPAEGGEWYGTGFLVASRLLLTNHHVLGTPHDAAQAEAEFAFEHDLDGVLQPPIQFNLTPHEIFFSDPALDVTFVSVAPLSNGGVPIERFGWLPLLPLSGKGVDGEWVTIIQHPNGGPKQISVRSNRIVDLGDDVVRHLDLEAFIHYATDTEPGSSGSPVLNDQWQVVALHHKAVPAPADADTPNQATQWIANEGVRISEIYNRLERLRLDQLGARKVLERLEHALGFPAVRNPVLTGGEDALEKDGKPFADSRWAKTDDLGYDADFLATPIALAPIYARAKADHLVAPLLDGSGEELRYRHFSVVVHAQRRFALLTAVNIDGNRLRRTGKRPGAWRRDGRMDARYQPDGAFYEKARGSDKIQFSRGHLVRYLDPGWGDDDAEARRAVEDSFHYTNAAPQVQGYNDVDWGNLEDYVLNRAQMSERRMSVFQGPIFRARDPLFGRDREGGPWQIPMSYWKIAVLLKAPGRLSAAAFIVGQTQYLAALFEARVFSGLRPYTVQDMRDRGLQTTIATIEDETGLDFSAIRAFDAHGSLESTRQTRWITQLDDITI